MADRLTFHQRFIRSIRQRRVMVVTFFAKKHQTDITRVLYPLDYGPPRGVKDPTPRYQFWDPKHKHPVSLRRKQIKRIMTFHDVVFDEREFVTWKPQWQVPR